MKFSPILAISLSAISTSAYAQATYTGEGSFAAGYTTGNTETTNAGIGLKLAREASTWRQSGEFKADYGENEGLENQNRIFAAGQLDRKFDSPRWTAYGRTTYEQDKFSGFDNRAFVGGGLGYIALDGDKATWTIEGGPGWRFDTIAESTSNDVVTPSYKEDSVALRAGSTFNYRFNENVTFSNDTNAVYAEASTQFVNGLSLTANLFNDISARFSVDVRYDTDPPSNRTEKTDTATKISFVYAFSNQ
ncbi:DUF481 domain-containing protein [Hirschia baltica]|uniref:Salt-induced outer membrane protein n=1 Tax=Hirschia baltica (strain ATCC 49814 / DSM 5838 / IFAM 1418) TaxID=582402 RepID=C6XPW9_HIRBI|nr:DUF481 domain-containing protein [Hirschia baltica]ACT58486.1 protein of unknown function DUF481 [Hirschia baltica ATCC 49814]